MASESPISPPFLTGQHTSLHVSGVQCGPDLEDTLRTAKFCFMTHLHPHLGKHISVDIDAKDKDLFVHQPYGYMHLEGGSIGLSLVLALVKMGTSE